MGRFVRFTVPNFEVNGGTDSVFYEVWEFPVFSDTVFAEIRERLDFQFLRLLPYTETLTGLSSYYRPYLKKFRNGTNDYYADKPYLISDTEIENDMISVQVLGADRTTIQELVYPKVALRELEFIVLEQPLAASGAGSDDFSPTEKIMGRLCFDMDLIFSNKTNDFFLGKMVEFLLKFGWKANFVSEGEQVLVLQGGHKICDTRTLRSALRLRKTILREIGEVHVDLALPASVTVSLKIAALLSQGCATWQTSLMAQSLRKLITVVDGVIGPGEVYASKDPRPGSTLVASKDGSQELLETQVYLPAVMLVGDEAVAKSKLMKGIQRGVRLGGSEPGSATIAAMAKGECIDVYDKEKDVCLQVAIEHQNGGVSQLWKSNQFDEETATPMDIITHVRSIVERILCSWQPGQAIELLVTEKTIEYMYWILAKYVREFGSVDPKFSVAICDRDFGEKSMKVLPYAFVAHCMTVAYQLRERAYRIVEAIRNNKIQDLSPELKTEFRRPFSIEERERFSAELCQSSSVVKRKCLQKLRTDLLSEQTKILKSKGLYSSEISTLRSLAHGYKHSLKRFPELTTVFSTRVKYNLFFTKTVPIEVIAEALTRLDSLNPS